MAPGKTVNSLLGGDLELWLKIATDLDSVETPVYRKHALTKILGGVNHIHQKLGMGKEGTCNKKYGYNDPLQCDLHKFTLSAPKVAVRAKAALLRNH